MTSQADTLPAFPMARDARCPMDPPPEYRRIRAEDPACRATLWNGQVVRLVTRHADQRAILVDPRFSADSTRPGHPPVSAAQAASLGKTRSFVFMDDPEHDRYRRMLIGEFSIRRMSGMRPRIQRAVDDLIDRMLAGGPGAELNESLAHPLPSLVICELLGVPFADREFFETTNRVLVARDVTTEEAAAARVRIGDYLDELIAAKDRDPGDDLISRLVVEQVRPGHLTPTELSNTCTLLLLAGHEPTSHTIALGVLTLLDHPDQAAAIRDSADSALVAGAVEEVLRRINVGQNGIRRVATEDVTVGGQLIRAGEGVVLLNDAANFDERAFPDPERFDIRRPGARHHLTFGAGTHHCLGAPLARLELQVVFRTLLRRVPGLRVAVPLEQLRFRHEMGIYGVHELPVTW